MFETSISGVVLAGFVILVLSVLMNILQQIFLRNPHEPPVVFHWFPLIGSTITYGIDPFKFFFDCQAKYGDVFTFILLGGKVTVYLGTKGNQFILNGKLKDVSAEEVYSTLTTPVFGKDVVYDVPNAKFMEQKKFIKFGLATDALRTYVPLMESEIRKYFRESLDFKTSFCNTNLPSIMAQITLFTAARTLQGNEVREKLDLTVAGLYHDLDDGFQPINFMLPWFPSPKNRRRDEANRKMTQIYADIIQSRRSRQKDSEDMLWTLMSSTYKDGKQVPDNEIAHLMIALLMAGQHSTSVTSSWIMLNLAARPEVQDALYEEQLQVFGPDLGSMPLTYDGLQSLPLLINVIRETLRLHSPIHSIMRKVKNPLPVPDTSWVVPTSHVLLAAPSTIGKTDKYFPDARRWDPYRWESIPDPKSMERQKMDYGYGLVSTGADSTYLPFGAGRHRCIGENFANCQLAVVVSLMVRFFRITNLEGQEGVVKTDYSSLFSRPMEPAMVRLEKRENVWKDL